ncbi:MAG: type I-E CRISPR-associated endonuclease Cas1 [Deltaproteobacteria bacterium]|nr:type I-E CRISPR-associated endonuclease Cas1 [Deltaproteobacteria bacterium]
MKITDLHDLPKLRDGLGYLYVERAHIEQKSLGVVLDYPDTEVPIPSASLAALLLGPGTTISHAAVRALADNGCSIIWCGEGAVRVYAQGVGETRKGHRLLRQAELVCNPDMRAQVVMRMYRMRFEKKLPEDLTIEQVRGMEGVRVREAYAQAAKRTGIIWTGRAYRPGDWNAADPVNRALSAANSCLYGVCHAAIVSAGYSTGLGFVHTGKQLSFVYDIADLYKVETTIPVAFECAANPGPELERRVRTTCRDVFLVQKILQRVVPDIARALAVDEPLDLPSNADPDVEAAIPGGLWDPDHETVEGGVNYGGDDSGERPREPEGGAEPVDD